MKKLAVLPSLVLVLASTTIAAAEPVHLGFGDPVRTPRPLTLAALPAATASEDGAPLAEPVRDDQPRTIFGLPKNVGTGDRILRTVVGVALLGTGIWGLSSDEHLSNTASGILMGVSAVPFATAATGYCPLYQALGIHESF